MKTIFVQMFQPFAQYRNPFTFYYAQTYPLPPKSTIIGMLQNACDDWYGNLHRVNPWWDLKVAIFGGFESVYWNYQQLIKGEVTLNYNNAGSGYLPLYGKLHSQRSPVCQQELFNGHLYLFIRGENELIDKIKDALNTPQKILSLGRSEDIVFITNKVAEIYDEDMKTEGIRGNVQIKYPTYIQLTDKNMKKLDLRIERYPVYHIPKRVIFENDGKPIKHKSEIDRNVTERNVEFVRVMYTGQDRNILLKPGFEVETDVIKLNGRRFRILHGFGWM